VSNLAVRILTAVVLAPLLVLAIRWQNPIGVWFAVIMATALALNEYFAITMQRAGDRAFGVATGLVYAALVYWAPGAAVAAAAAAVVVAAFLFFLLRPGAELQAAVSRVGLTTYGVFYVALLSFVALLKRDHATRGDVWVYLLLTVTWFSDTAAYFAGRAFGRHKLYPQISPGKTWEGALGGLAGSFGAAALAHLWYMPELGWGHAALVSIPAGALGQLGDLCESLLKRAYGVKDSGKVLPGHGGLLDRIDALLFATPYVYFYARFAL
jgi:phosphatidate cytidylyltransferase